MVDEQELTVLLHRADWTRLALSGSVFGEWPVLNTVTTTTSAAPPWKWGHDEAPPEPPFRPFAMQEDGESAELSLTVAPGRRYLVRNADGSHLLGSDGERVWQRLGDLPPSTSLRFDGRPRVPFAELLAPSWLLSGYALELGGEVTVCGRAGVRVLGTPRAATTRPPRVSRRLRHGSGDLLFSPPPRWQPEGHWDEVAAIIDAELGILLRCSRRSGDRAAVVTEFTALDVGQQAEAAVFAAPPGSFYGGSGAFGSGSRTAGPAAGTTSGETLGDAIGGLLGAAGKEAAKTLGGIAAGGLGAVIKYGPWASRPDPFAQATEEAENPDAAMPTDERDPDGPDGGGLTAVPDEVLHLLYRGGLAAPRFSATLHQWTDTAGLFAAVPPSARGAGFGGVGFLMDALRDKAREDASGISHSAVDVRMGGWAEYRIDLAGSHRDGRPSPRHGRNRPDPLTIASDGTRQWQVFADHVLTGPTGSAPAGLTALLDGSWLLERDLTGGDETWAGGRRGYRIVVRERKAPNHPWDLFERFFLPAVVIVDAETGRLLRTTRFKGGLPMFRQELRDIAELDGAADFGFTPPAGLPVEDTSADEDTSRPEWPWEKPGAPRFW